MVAPQRREPAPAAPAVLASPVARATQRSSLVYPLLARAVFAFFDFVFGLVVSPLEAGERFFPADAAPSRDAFSRTADARPTLSFGGCGMLYPYQLGVAEYVAEEFDVSCLRCAGHSAGFAAATTLAAAVPVATHAAVLAAARARWAARRAGFVADSTSAWMAPYLTGLAPHEGAVLAAAADGRLCLGHTRVAFAFGWGKPLLRGGHCVTSRFESLKAFVYTITVSQRCPPFYMNPGWLHGSWGFDGAFSSQFTLPPNCDASKLITVSPTNPLADVSPTSPFPPLWFASLPDAARWATLMAAGRADAAAARGALLAKGLRPRARRGGAGSLAA